MRYWNSQDLPEPWRDVDFSCDLEDDFGCMRLELMDDLEAYKTGKYNQGFDHRTLRSRVLQLFPDNTLKAIEIIDYYNLPDY